jgi:endonuclease/exonuclease/phosphatase family metal-dependent hydrolase
VLTYNVKGNGVEDWSTNALQVQAIGRIVQHLQPDVVTFNEIPQTNGWQMTNFVAAWLPGYSVARNSGTDGFIRSVIVSRYPVTASRRWLARANLVAFGYDGPFTRDLFEAEIAVPYLEQPLHVFTTHLKAGTTTNDLLRRGAEASAVSNFFVSAFLPAASNRLYLLTGDFNEDILRPLAGTHRPVQRLTNESVGLRLTTPRNPINSDDRTISSSSPFARFDYILPCASLFSNIATSQVFRTDLLAPRPVSVNSNDSRIASDHLPVLMTFNNPAPFRMVSIGATNQWLQLQWQAFPGSEYSIYSSSNLASWLLVNPGLTSTGAVMSWTSQTSGPRQFFRVLRLD